MIEMFARLMADARAVGGQFLEFFLREGLQNIDQGKELRLRPISCHVIHVTISIPYEANSRVGFIEAESGRTGETLHRFFVLVSYPFKRCTNVDSVSVAIPSRDRTPTRRTHSNDRRAKLPGMPPTASPNSDLLCGLDSGYLSPSSLGYL
jgi:hypothetical protein